MEATSDRNLWKNKNFVLLSTGQIISWFGTEVTGIALPLVVLALTGSTALAGTIAAVRGFVYVLWAIPAGALIDRWNKKTVMVVSNLGSGMAMLSIVIALLLHRLTIPQLYIAGMIEGSFFVFANLARFASLPRIVPKEQFPAAIAHLSIGENTIQVIAPPLGGFLYQTVGAFMAFLIDTASYFINGILLLFVKTPLHTLNMQNGSITKEIHEGIKWLWNNPSLRFVTIIVGGRTVIASAFYLLVIALAKEIHLSSLTIGAIFAIGAGGGIIGSLFASRIHKKFRLKQILVTTLVLSFIIFCFYSLAFNAIILAIVTAALFAVMPAFDVTTSAYSASVVPDEIRGRITGLNRLVALGAYSLGFFITGVFLQYRGSTFTIIAFSGLLLFLSLITAMNKKLNIL